MTAKNTPRPQPKQLRNVINPPIACTCLKEAPAIKVSICIQVKGNAQPKEIELQLRWILEQFLPMRRDKIKAHDAVFKSKPMKGCFWVIGKLTLRPEYRERIFRAVADIQKAEPKYELLALSVRPVIVQVPHLSEKMVSPRDKHK